MKLKRLPEDFQVEELTDLAPHGGQHAYYRLTKRGIGTPEAVTAIARRWNLDRRRIGYGGLKDKHALTTQFVTILHGPRQAHAQESFALEYLGQVDRPFHADHIRGNRFAIVLRDFEQTSEQFARLTATIQRNGVANYFDDQRFGSLGASGQFVARAWLERDYEGACRLALCDPTDSDRPRDRDDRQRIAQQWGNWSAIARRLDPGWRRDLVEHLSRAPQDFRRAITRIDQEQRSMYLAAYQSFLWNEIASALLRQICDPTQLTPLALKASQVVFHRELDDHHRAILRDLDIPLPSARLAPPAGMVEDTMTRVLAEHGLQRRQLKIDYPRDSFFSKGTRKLIVFPEGFTAQLTADELHPGRDKALLKFDLPRAAYATMVVKRLTL